MFHDVQKKKKKPNWLGEELYGRLQEYWDSDAFKKWSNQASKACNSERGSFLNTCGSVSVKTHAWRLAIELGRPATESELFIVMHKKKNAQTGVKDKWVEQRADMAFTALEYRLTEQCSQAESAESTASTQGPSRTEKKLLLEASGEPNRTGVTE